MIKNVRGLHVKNPLFLYDFNDSLIFLTDVRKTLKFRENSSSGSRVVPCGRTDRHDEANCRFSQLYELA